jgi:medium-chain acyl-[acyl-carrier-protein] hydrolase
VAAIQTKWVAPYHRRSSGALLRLFCFPYAGGGGSVFLRALAGLTPSIEVCPVQLPGRENRLSEPLLTSVPEVARSAASGLQEYFDMPFAFFGHSLGAIIAYELAQVLRGSAGPQPRRLVVSAHRAPHLPSPHQPTWDLPDPEFKKRVVELNGTPKEVLENEELQALVLPIIRADFRLDETYLHDPDQGRLHCPITAIGGLLDYEVPGADLRAWSAVTVGQFELKMIDGDHFFLHTRAPALTSLLGEALRA